MTDTQRSPAPPRSLVRLARLHSIAPVHVGADRQQRVASEPALLAMLRALGIDIDRADRADEVLRATWSERATLGLDAVSVCWQGESPVLAARLSPSSLGRPLRGSLELEDGSRRELEWPTGGTGTAAIHRVRERRIDGRALRDARLPLPRDLPLGVHRLTLDTGASQSSTTLIVAPLRGHAIPGRPTAVFAPLYALTAGEPDGCATFTHWSEWGRWLGSCGVQLAGSLPLCAAFLEPPVEPSPYAPVSRLFWNEAYLDLAALPDRPRSDAPSGEPGPGSHVDWLAHAKRQLDHLQHAADAHFETHGPTGSAELRAFVAEQPSALDYAAFRARQQQHGRDWRSWPVADRDAAPHGEWPGSAAGRRHLYAQWQCRAQIEGALAEMAGAGVEPYLDLPVGVHADGYDAWRYRDAFLTGCSAGAPPDAFFTKGQDWGFAPPHPGRTRQDGHAYFRACLRHQLRHCGVLRVDHVMGLHRMWSIPHGLPASLGCYVQQPAEELYALLLLESARQRCAVVGEDLGTVPPGTERAMDRHDLTSMHVMQFALAPGKTRESLAPSARDLACLNTHDMPTFAAYQTGGDIPDRVDLGILDDAGAERETRRRGRLLAALRAWLGQLGYDTSGEDSAASQLSSTLRACLEELARSDARIAVLSVEDLWLETAPQNVPGTCEERPNWRRRMARPMAEILTDETLASTLRSLVEARLRPPPQDPADPASAETDPG